MLTETGLITKIENDIVWVNTQNKLACSSCKVESSCGNGILEKYLAGKVFVSQIDNRLNAQLGDEIVIGIPKSSITKASLLVYGAPLFGLLVGSLIGQLVFSSEGASITLAVIGFVSASYLASLFAKKMAQNNVYKPVMLSKKTQSVKYYSVFEQVKFKSLD
jgi:sigma-E factor negative regulatory protein RseC